MNAILLLLCLAWARSISVTNYSLSLHAENGTGKLLSYRGIRRNLPRCLFLVGFKNSPNSVDLYVKTRCNKHLGITCLKSHKDELTCYEIR